MLRFQASIHGSNGQIPGSLTVSFDQSLKALHCLSRLFIEPDGSFVWPGATEDGERWQVDGNLIDRGDCLAYVELGGWCPEKQFDELLAVFGWPGESLVFQLRQSGLLVDEQEFRRRAATEIGAV
jgi:hypothetical protein